MYVCHRRICLIGPSSVRPLFSEPRPPLSRFKIAYSVMQCVSWQCLAAIPYSLSTSLPLAGFSSAGCQIDEARGDESVGMGWHRPRQFGFR